VTSQRIGVQGQGIAALYCLQLLQGQGYNLEINSEYKSRRLPAILISQSTQKLLADIFPGPELFAEMPRIRQRIVAWHSREPLVLRHDAVVASESALWEQLTSRIGKMAENGSPQNPEWTIVTSLSASGLGSGTQKHFGSRTARAHPVDLTADAEAETCWVESTGSGWLFLLTTRRGAGSLLSVGGDAESLLGTSRLIAGKVQRLQPAAGEFPAYPRTLEKLCDANCLACGSAAMTFDPLCGEGAGHAAREAILACAAVRAIHAGQATEEVLAEYAMRLRLGFLRHLQNCLEFYRQDAPGEFWREEWRRLEQGLSWAQEQLAAAGSPRFRLVDFTLERIAPPEAHR
jgi:hypothetical protein